MTMIAATIAAIMMGLEVPDALSPPGRAIKIAESVVIRCIPSATRRRNPARADHLRIRGC